MSKLARTYGVSAVSAALRVEYYALKDRVEGARKVSGVAKPSLPTFLELKSPMLGQSIGSQVELQDSSGNKMIVRLDSGVDLDLVSVMQVFWSRET